MGARRTAARLDISLHAVSVRRGGKWVLRDITLRLAAGERWALIGDNGAGKTQLLKLLAGDVWPTPTGREKRSYRLGRREIDLIEAKPRIAYVGAELQDKYARYGWDLSVRDLIAAGLHGTDLLLWPATAAERGRVTATLRACGLGRLAGRRFSSLSYGQKRLALLACALARQPDWLLLDEFYNGLDTGYRRRIERILETVRAAGRSWIAVTHRAGDVPRGTRGIIELHDGRLRSIKAIGRAAVARLAGGGGPGPNRKRRRRTATAAVHGRAAGPLLLRLERADLYVDYRAVLLDLNWELRKGQHWAVFGANGSGKTSFLKLLYGDLSPALGGRIERAGFPAGTPISLWKQQVGYVSPELQADYAVDVTIRDLVASGRHASIGLADAPTVQDRRAAARWLRYFRLVSVAGRRPRELSYGQLRRALIARALTAQARILLLDEPLTGLDPRQRAAMKRLLEPLMRKHLTVVIAVHHAEDLPRGMTHGLRLHKRRAYPSDGGFAT
ncbi:MAG: ATP-binding cassette domain-containing protein [Steroidobacteraceae bacterium]